MRLAPFAAIAAALIVSYTQIASAADLPVKATPMVSPPIYSWNGFYAGVNGGWGVNGTGGDTYCVTPGGAIQGVGCSILPNGNLKPSGLFGGGQIDYNFQSGRFVYGIEADIQAADISDSVTISSAGFPVVGGGLTVPGSFSLSQKLDWFGTVRGRVGWTLWDRTLLYATGGLIYGRESVSQNLSAGGLASAVSDSSVRTGWTIGGGLEYAFLSNFTARIEGLYYDMSEETISFTFPDGFIRNSTFDFRGGLIRAALNFKFGP